ncbi:ArnT family glycosyltransferase [Oenococcus sicerae]|uniref:ArnT family glycosyltransferase n=1 Tax=Oenococcus sicerae TaxID=2203724 RepID=UPI0039E9F1B0
MTDKLKRIDPWLLVILAIALFLYAWRINSIGNANTFYTAATTSMLENWKAFWYGSFDPANFITVDKPPIALWLIAISTKIFGIHGWSLALPNLLASLGSVLLLYNMIRFKFGLFAGRIAALFMTVTPIVVADTRTNNLDAMMIFCMLLAIYVLQKAVISHKLSDIFISFALVGIAFNIKMLEAFMILPTMFIYYFLASKQVKKSRLVLGFFVALAGLGIFSFSYPIIVDNTPKMQRPYVGSSQNDSLLNLAFGYNGAQRLLGQSSGTSSTHQGMKNSLFNQENIGPLALTVSPKKILENLGRPSNIGNPGLLRLFGLSLGTQISWFLPLALFGLAVGLFNKKKPKNKFWHFTDQQIETILWAGWLIPAAGFFSIAGFFHPYYTILLAPAIAALASIGISRCLTAGQRWPKIILAFVFLGTVFLQIYYCWYYETHLSIAMLIISLLVFAYCLFSIKRIHYFLLISCFLPLLWCLVATFGASSAAFPSANPKLLLTTSVGKIIDQYLDDKDTGIPLGLGKLKNGCIVPNQNTKLLTYLQSPIADNHSSRFMFATTDSSTAAPFIIQSKRAVMAIGGYNGTDPAISFSQFKKMVAQGQIKYFYFGTHGIRILTAGSQNAKIAAWVIEKGRLVKTVSKAINKQAKTHILLAEHADELYKI